MIYCSAWSNTDECTSNVMIGKSEGEYVSLGHFEKYDLMIICDYLYVDQQATQLILWGRCKYTSILE